MAGTELEHVERKIQTIRGQKAILDADLAELYGGGDEEAERAGEAERREIPLGLRLPVESRGVRDLEIAVCDLK